jgi:hypothetical protein
MKPFALGLDVIHGQQSIHQLLRVHKLPPWLWQSCGVHHAVLCRAQPRRLPVASWHQVPRCTVAGTHTLQAVGSSYAEACWRQHASSPLQPPPQQLSCTQLTEPAQAQKVSRPPSVSPPPPPPRAAASWLIGARPWAPSTMPAAGSSTQLLVLKLGCVMQWTMCSGLHKACQTPEPC